VTSNCNDYSGTTESEKIDTIKGVVEDEKKESRRDAGCEELVV
jgi:hypothetical protein